MIKSFKIIYYIFIAFIGAIALMLIISALPITGNYKLLVVRSGSMEPSIKIGSIVLVKPVQDYKINEIITFRNPRDAQKPITHRINEIKTEQGREYYLTKGDANNSPDQRLIAKKEVIGKVLLDIPYLGYVIETARKPLGFMFLIVLPAIIIIFDEARKIYKEIKVKKKAVKQHEQVYNKSS